jgi:hypothetical protein
LDELASAAVVAVANSLFDAVYEPCDSVVVLLDPGAERRASAGRTENTRHRRRRELPCEVRVLDT